MPPLRLASYKLTHPQLQCSWPTNTIGSYLLVRVLSGQLCQHVRWGGGERAAIDHPHTIKLLRVDAVKMLLAFHRDMALYKEWWASILIFAFDWHERGQGCCAPCRCLHRLREIAANFHKSEVFVQRAFPCIMLYYNSCSTKYFVDLRLIGPPWTECRSESRKYTAGDELSPVRTRAFNDGAC